MASGETRYRLGSAHIFVDDLPKAREFYAEKMGMSLTYEEAGFFIIDTGESTLMVFDGRGGGDRIGGGTGLHFSVDAIDALVAELTTKGVTFLGEPRTHDWGGRMVGFTDPAGNVSHLVQYPA